MPAYERIHTLFIESGLLITNTAAAPETSSVRQFIEPRLAMVRAGELTRLLEIELSQTTQVLGNVAHRFSAYVKSGTMKGIAFEARGMVRVSDSAAHGVRHSLFEPDAEFGPDR